MLGRLARWLRLVGFDTRYDPHLDDRAIARIAAHEGRIVLTRDRGLLARRTVRGGVLVASDDLGAQLQQVVTELGLAIVRERIFSRCTACNGEVEPVDRDAVRGRVPPYVLRAHERFLSCRTCGRIFWPGTHQALALAELDRLLGRLDEPGAGP